MYNIHSKLETNAYENDSKKVVLKKGVTTVTPEELEHLTSNEVFKLHKANGFVTISDAPETSEADEEDDSNPPTLKGSKKQPEAFTLEDDSVVTIDQVITEAFNGSELTHDQWNALKAKDREKLIQNAVDELPIKEA